MTSRLAIRLLSPFALFGLVHCGPPPLAPCPDAGTQLTYENFGDSFIGTYCVQCHGAALRSSGDQAVRREVNSITPPAPSSSTPAIGATGKLCSRSAVA